MFKGILVLTAAIVSALVFWNMALLVSRVGKVEVTIVAAPTTSQVSIDGSLTTEKKVYLSPGTHVFEASFRSFDPDTKKITIRHPQTISLAPAPKTAEDLQYLSQNPSLQQERESVGGEAATQAGQTITRKYPFIDQLPLIDRNFAIYQAAPVRSKVRAGDPTIALQVDALNPIDRQHAIDRLKTDFGIDPSTIEFIFTHTSNPFEGVR